MGNKRLGSLTDTLQTANGRPAFAGTVTGTAATSNSDTGTPFTLAGGEWLMLQPDSACYVGFGTTSALAKTASSSTNGVKLASDEKFSVVLLPTEGFVAMTPLSGTTNMKVWTQS